VDKAFLKFDKNAFGVVNIHDLKVVYNCGLHPKVQAHMFTEEQAFDEFASNFASVNRDGTITRDVTLQTQPIGMERLLRSGLFHHQQR
jgi:hypothetical protein